MRSKPAQAPWQVPAAYWENNPYAPPANGYYPVRPLVPYVTNYSPPLVYPSAAPGNNAPNPNSTPRFSPEQKVAILKQHLLVGVPVNQLCHATEFARMNTTDGRSDFLPTVQKLLLITTRMGMENRTPKMRKIRINWSTSWNGNWLRKAKLLIGCWKNASRQRNRIK